MYPRHWVGGSLLNLGLLLKSSSRNWKETMSLHSSSDGRWFGVNLLVCISAQVFSLLPTAVPAETCLIDGTSQIIPHPPRIHRQVEQVIFYDSSARPRHEIIRCPVEQMTANDEDTEISWWFTDSSSPTVRKKFSDGMELAFTPLKSSHIGEFVCEARNKIGVSRSNVLHVRNVTHTKIPDGAPKRLRFTLFAGQFVSLHCPTPDGIPAPKVHWQLVSGKPCEKPCSVVDPTGTLHIPFVSVEKDNGSVWHCVVSQLEAKKIFQIVTLEIRPRPVECAAKPRWLYLNKQVVMKKGENAELFCVTSGPDWLAPRWDIDSALKAAVHGNSSMPLRIDSSAVATTGRTRFHLTCSSNGLTSSIILSIKAAPTIIYLPKREDVNEGDTFSVDCEATGIPAPKIEWSFNGEDVLPSGMRIEKKNRIAVDKAHLRHQGVLRCVATNVHGTIYREVQVMVYSAMPQIIAERRCFIAVEGDNVTIPCTARGHPQPNLRWSHNGSQLKVDNLNHTLELINVRHVDNGVYTCHACGDVCAEFDVTLDVLPAKLEKMPPKPLEALEGDHLKLTCVVRGRHPSGNKIRWKVNGTFVHEGETYDIEEPLKQGTYSCELNNGTKLGADLWEAELRVLKRPSVPKLNEQCRSGEVKLGWVSKAQEESVLWYEIQRRPQRNRSWQSIGSVEANADNGDKMLQFKAELPKVRESYTFRVIAHNRAGSNSSTHTELCKASTGYPPLRSPDGIRITRNGNLVHVNWNPLQPHERNGAQFYYSVSVQKKDGKATSFTVSEPLFSYIIEQISEIGTTEFTIQSVNEYAESSLEQFVYDCAVSMSNLSVEHVSSTSVRLRWAWKADEEGCADGAFSGALVIRQFSYDSNIHEYNIYDKIVAQSGQSMPTLPESEVLVQLKQEQHLLNQLDDQRLYCVHLRAWFRPDFSTNNTMNISSAAAPSSNYGEHRCSAYPSTGWCNRTWESSGGEVCFYPSVVFEEMPVSPVLELRNGVARLLEPPPNTELFYHQHSAEKNVKNKNQHRGVDYDIDANENSDVGEQTLTSPQWLRSNTSVQLLLDHTYSVRLVQLTSERALGGTAVNLTSASTAIFSPTAKGAVTDRGWDDSEVPPTSTSLPPLEVDDRAIGAAVFASTSNGASTFSERVCRLSPIVTLRPRSDPSLWLLWFGGSIGLLLMVFITLVLLFRKSSGMEFFHEEDNPEGTKQTTLNNSMQTGELLDGDENIFVTISESNNN